MIKIKKKMICDCSNIACFNKRNHAPKLRNIDQVYLVFSEKFEIIGIADRSLYNEIDEQRRYLRKYLIPKIIIETPDNSKADGYILNYALENDAFILSNDHFKEYGFVSREWLNAHRISFMFIKDKLIFSTPIELIIRKL